jgi:hypothetical protein
MAKWEPSDWTDREEFYRNHPELLNRNNNNNDQQDDRLYVTLGGDGHRVTGRMTGRQYVGTGIGGALMSIVLILLAAIVCIGIAIIIGRLFIYEPPKVTEALELINSISSWTQIC